MMEANFKSAHLLIDRAKKHAEEFEYILSDFNRKKPYEHFIRKRGVRHLFGIKMNEEIPPSLNVVLFDIVNCLRSSLDHAVYDGSVLMGRHPNPKNTKFPFGETEADAAGDFKRKRAEVPEKLQELILKEIRPYKENGNEILWKLNKLRNQKIHKTLTEMVISRGPISMGPKPGKPFIVNEFNFDALEPEWYPLRRELIYMKSTKMDMQDIEIDIVISVVMGEDTAFKGEDAQSIIYALIDNAFKSVSLISSSLSN